MCSNDQVQRKPLARRRNRVARAWFAIIPVIVATLIGCGSAVRNQTTAAPSDAPSIATVGSAAPSADGRCDGANATLLHQVPELEAVLPASVAGRQLARWSVRGRCWIEIAFNLPPAEIDAMIAELKASSHSGDLSHLMYGVAGRSVLTDPPFFVFGAGRGTQDEVEATLALMFGLTGFTDVKNAPDLSLYEERTIAGKTVYVGRADMIRQSEHQRGRPYLYQTDEYMFLVITDDEAWAEDAIRQLP
jgi:hypothetical protein